MKKKMVSVLLSLVVLISALPIQTFALEGDETAAEPRTVVSVNDLEGISVLYETPFEELNLPSQVTVVLDNEQSLTVGVFWLQYYYQPQRCSLQPIFGTLVLPEGVSNPNYKLAKCEVQVVAPTIVSVEEFASIEVDYRINVFSFLEKLHSTAQVRSEDGNTYTMSIVWIYDESVASGHTPGEYLVYGRLEGDPWGSISQPQASIKVTVKEPVEIVSVETLPQLEIWKGTTQEKLLKILQTKYPQVAVTLEDGSTETIPVAWDIANSECSGKAEGLHEIIGQLQIPYNSKVVNPESKTAAITISVIPPKSLETVKVGLGKSCRKK